MSRAKRYGTLLLNFLFLFGLLGAFAIPVSAADSTEPAICFGSGFAVALRSNGTALAWGDNSYGQLGNGTTVSATVPVEVAMPEGVSFSAIAAGSDHTLALSKDGKVYSWGSNTYGQLGYVLSGNHATTPQHVSALDGKSVIAVAAGNSFSLALMSDGTVWSWGRNNYKQLGDERSSVSGHVEPRRIQGNLSNVYVSEIVAGESTVAAIASDNTLYLWGNNSKGQLGDVASSGGLLPFQISRIEDCRSVALGKEHTTVLTFDGNVQSFGGNSKGQFGNGAQSDGSSIALNTAQGLTGVSPDSLAVGAYHTVLMGIDGAVYTWGDHSKGQLGYDCADTVIKTPMGVTLPNAALATVVAARENNSAVITDDGLVYTWGDNSYGQLGNATKTASSVPVPVAGVEGVGLLSLGRGSDSMVQRVPVSASATVPEPTYTVYIPATVDLGTLRQKSGTDEDRYSTKDMTIEVSGARYLFGEQKIVISATPSQNEFVLLDGSNRLTYELYRETDSDTPVTVGGVLAEFTANGSSVAKLRVDQSLIYRNGSYTGTITFSIALQSIHQERSVLE